MPYVSRVLVGLLLLSAAPVAASAQSFGDIEGTVSHTWLSGSALGGEDNNYFAGGAQIRAGTAMGGGFLVQGDLFGEMTNASNFGGYESGFGGALHLGWRDPRQGYLGLFGGALVTDQDSDSSDTSERYFVGAEGQIFSGRMTFYGQAGWFDGSGGSDAGGLDSLREAAFARGVVRYFINPNTKLEAELSGAKGKMDTDADEAWLIGWGLKLEQQFAGNWSASIGYAGAHYRQPDESDTINEHIVRLGLKYHFTPGTLLSQDRKGASLDTPAFLRWSAQTGGPLE